MYQIVLAPTAPCAEGSYEAYFPYNLKQGGTNVVFLAAYVYAINGEWREHGTMSHCFFFFVEIDELDVPNRVRIRTSKIRWTFGVILPLQLEAGWN